ncbi:MAG: hypothetical protein H0V17_29635, partial [Deltaproteobacteria bacterium]|nr:hypothetical protein [Deltaproteobacteria bacterium]
MARFCTSNVGYTLRSLGGLLSTRQPSVDELAWLTATWFKRSTRMAALRSRPGLHVVDVGVLQALWSIGFRATADRTAKLIETLRAEMPVADLVVLVDARPDTVARRLAARPGNQSRLERLG